ncbi:DUF4179 domain-containing protein [Paenibacillus sp. MDMC362]|uniref:DUF4179 domain-containing protein n=1 Tax=Paenibacillus sp. MDMC362 TaxID=2977365 RepID=UPI000DC49C81|nr:DUF4179 domain-containing protein [Paenibacillus sp. MDMC362]RAR44676.1 hypothetical protein DP091_05800 [Paenibacillus sp. MDMC362]
MSIEEQLKDQMHRAANHMATPQDIYDRVWNSTERNISNQGPLTRRSRNRSFIRKALVISTVAVLLGISIVSSAFISPAMAETLSRIPLMHNVFKLAGDLGLQTAEQHGLAMETHYRDTHDSFTLTASQVVFDGLRGGIALQLDGTGHPASLYDPHARSHYEDSFPKSKGSFGMMKAFVNGEEGGITWEIGPGSDTGSAIVTITGASLDGVSRRPPLPAAFDLTLEVRLEGIPEPFVLQIPMQQNTDTHALYPAAQKSSGDIGWKLEEMERSLVSTRLEMVLKDRSPDERAMFFEIVDQNGKEIRMVDRYGYDMNQGYRHYDMLYEPLPSDAQSFTIKPFRYAIEQELEEKKERKTASGSWKKEYIPALEMTIPIAGEQNK